MGPDYLTAIPNYRGPIPGGACRAIQCDHSLRLYIAGNATTVSLNNSQFGRITTAASTTGTTVPTGNGGRIMQLAMKYVFYGDSLEISLTASRRFNVPRIAMAARGYFPTRSPASHSFSTPKNS